MGFCSKCGNSLSKEAYFCPRCGAKTQVGIEANVSAPADEIRETMARIGNDIEKAFATAVTEVREAFITARENIRQSTGRERGPCPVCGEENSGDDSYCGKCGAKLHCA